MDQHNQKLEPARFEPVTPADPTGGPNKAVSARSPGSGTRLLLALGFLLLAAGLVIFWLPSQVPEPVLAPVQPPDTAPRQVQGAQLSPWSEAQLLRQRKAAQDVLAQLLEEQFTLEESAVEQWAGDDFAAALALAAEADQLYRQQQFPAATAGYQRGLERLLAIGEAAPRIFAEHLRRGQSAIEELEPEQAIHHLELARLIEPDSREVALALNRASYMEQVKSLLEEAAAARRNQDLDLRLRLLQQAAALDAEHRQVATALAQTRKEITQRDFLRAMSAGYAALDQQDFALAEKKFLAAKRLAPGSQETDAALEETRASRTQNQIDNLAGQARAAETEERWPQAVSGYREILEIDETLVFARAGLIRSSTRAGLEQRLLRIIDQPLRLAEARVLEQARQTLSEAAALKQPGPRLLRQLEQVRETLRIAVTPIPIALRSDELTEVSINRVARLGRFLHHQLELTPGTYTAVGVRSGYRDVRRKFTVVYGQTNPAIEIRCVEPI
ncbi:MAG: hypothetical protein OXC05_12690 [Halieaceae bacterium]|nr:hypothetical protein [Halieaceae bacterium]